MKYIFIVTGIVFFVLAIFLFARSNGFTPAAVQKANTLKLTGEESRVIINSTAFTLEIARTSQEKATGLGGRVNLPANAGMLFIYDNPARNSFWMRGMLIPLDIIFLLDREIVAIYEDLPPAAKNDPYPPTWGNDVISNRVLEINAGLTKKYNIKVGDKVSFQIK